MLHQVGHPRQDSGDSFQTNCRARLAQRLAALDGVVVKCFAFDSKVPDLCQFESHTSCLVCSEQEQVFWNSPNVRRWPKHGKPRWTSVHVSPERGLKLLEPVVADELRLLV